MRMAGRSPSNLHLFLSNLTADGRLFKEARYTIAAGLFATVTVVGLWADGLEEHEQRPSGIRIVRRKTLVRRVSPESVFRRVPILYQMLMLAGFLGYSLTVLAEARRSRPTHVSCHNVVMLPVAWLAARLAGAHLVYVPHELETRRALLSRSEQWTAEWLEKRFMRRVRDTVVVCEPIAAWYRNAYGLSNVHVVRNVPERAAVTVRKIESGDFRSRFGIPDRARLFIYQGLFGPERGTTALLEIFRALDTERCHLILMGYGDEASTAEIMSHATDCNNIHYQPAVSAEEIVSYSAGADIGVFITWNDALSYRYSLPNKFFEYAHAGLPILVSANLIHLSQLVASNGLGWSVPTDRVAETISELSTVDLEPFRERVRRFVADAVWERDAEVFRTVYRP